MPVSNISVVGVRFSTDGAERWIGQRTLTSISSPSSIGSPSRLKMRPSVTSPTGTVIGPPVSSTSIPRARPSVVSMATARTRSSPRCCCTSHTSTPASPPPARSGSSSPVGSWRTMIAELISGSLSGNTASMTTPWISSIRPTFFWPSRCPSGFCCSVVSSVLASTAFLSDQGFRPGNDFHDLLGDLGLALAVHLQRQVLDQLAGVLGRVAHRGHARAVLGGGGLEQRAVDRDLDVGRHEPLEDLLGVGLVLDERARPGALVALVLVALGGAAVEAGVLTVRVLEDRRVLERQQRLLGHLLRQRRDVAVVEDLHAVDVAVDVRRDQVGGDVARVAVRRAVGEPGVGATRLAVAERQRRHPAPAGGEELERLALALELGGMAHAGAHDLRVERAGQAAVAGDQQDADRGLGLVLLEDREARHVLRRLGGLARHPPDRARVGPQVLDALLGAAQPRGGDHLHRARDLLDVLDRPDPVLDVLLRHGLRGRARGLLLALLGLLLLAAVLVALLAPGALALDVDVVRQRLALLVEVVAEVLGEVGDRVVELALHVV